MSKKWLKVALMVTAIATGTSIQVDAETVLYVPQDDRPVSLQYTVDTAKAAGDDGVNTTTKFDFR